MEMAKLKICDGTHAANDRTEGACDRKKFQGLFSYNIIRDF